MHKSKLTIFILIILSITFCIHSSVRAIADDICVDCEGKSPPVPTLAGNADYSKMNCGCEPYIPLEFDSNNPENISPGGSITISVLDGCPPFIWKDPGEGYSWLNGDDVGPPEDKTKMTTARSNQLKCSSGT